MILQTLFMLAVIGIAASTFLETQLLFAKAAGKRLAESYAVQALPRAEAYLLRQAAGQIAVDGPATTLAPPAMPADCVSPSYCSLKISATYAVTGSTMTVGGAATAQNLQTAALASEQHVSVKITVTATDASGNPIASHTALATLRTFAAAPYVAPAGLQDIAVDDTADAQTDTAGCDPASPTTCDPSVVATVDDTRLHARQTCKENGNGGSCTGAPALSDDTFANSAWTNGNVSATGWSR